MFIFKLSSKILAGLAIIAILGYSFYALSGLNKTQKINVYVDETVILEKIQNLEKLETVSMTLQRDFEIVLENKDFSIFGLTLLENKRTQTIAVTGTVVAGVDLSLIQKDDIKISAEDKKMTLKLPPPTILSINILEDKTRLLKDDWTTLFTLSNLTSAKKIEVQEILLQQAIKQSKNVLSQSACEADILDLANQNSTNFFENNPFASLVFEEIEIQTQNNPNCFVFDEE